MDIQSIPDIFGRLYFGNTITQYAIFFGYIAIALIIGKILYYLTTGIIRKFTSKTRTKLDDLLIDMIEEPLVFLIILGGFFFGYNQMTLSENTLSLFSSIFRVLLTIAVSWLIIRLVDALIVNYMMPFSKNTKTELDDVLFPLIRKIVKIILIMIALIMILDNMGYHVTSILAGLGIGGLAFALAAQDILGNFFGGLTIIIDKPFKIGEYIEVGGHQGEIVEIGLRSTRLKTPNGEFITMPNRFITEKATINHKIYNERLIVMILGLDYSTKKEQIKKAKELVKKSITSKPLIKKDSVEANFISFGQSSFDLEIRYILQTNDAQKVREAKDRINEEIKEMFEKNRIKLAYPTQTIRIEK